MATSLQRHAVNRGRSLRRVKTLVVTIGRNVGSQPMDGTAWMRFKVETRKVVASWGIVVFAGEGQGIWKGQTERAYTVIVSVTGRPAESSLYPLRIALYALGKAYGQEAIAITLGKTEFAQGGDV